MSKSNNYISLGNSASELIDGSGKPGVPRLLDYKHAARLFVDDYQIRAPKYGFSYYVNFLINQNAVIDSVDRNLGLYVKKIDLPKYALKTETLNQYNRKTTVTTGITYNPVNMEFHDDNAGITNTLWANYYKHTIADSNYDTGTSEIPKQYRDTKFGTDDYEYGMYNRGVLNQFFERIDIYVLHHTLHEFTKISLINPRITEWRHDSLNNTEGTKILTNSMTVSYENVFYTKGSHQGNINQLPGYVNEFYDPTQSPLKIGGNIQNDPIRNESVPLRPSNAVIFDRPKIALEKNPLFDKAGRARAYNVPSKQITNFDRAAGPRLYGLVNSPYSPRNPLLDIASILAKNYLNQNGLGRVGARGYNIASSVVNNSIRSPAGKFYEPPRNDYNPGVLNLPGGIGFNVFKGFNTGVDGKLRVNPAAILLPPKR